MSRLRGDDRAVSIPRRTRTSLVPNWRRIAITPTTARASGSRPTTQSAVGLTTISTARPTVLRYLLGWPLQAALRGWLQHANRRQPPPATSAERLAVRPLPPR